MIVNKFDPIIINQLENIVYNFIEESSYNISYNKFNTIDYLSNIINDYNSDLIVVYSDDNIAGFSIVSRSNEFHNEYFGYLIKFYILPKYRKTKAARTLIEESVIWFDEQNCVQSFATATARVGQDKLFINLLKKFGYTQETTCLVRNKYE
jgi:GNAT superfamily N-acetyltransferase